MDQIKIGKYIASLRKEHSITQEELGDKLGVTNKTVSRWENGTYMPDIEKLLLLSKEFGVGINDLLAGEEISDENFRKKAEDNIVAIAKSTIFSFDDRKKYFKRKWRREHIWVFVVYGLILLPHILIPILFDKTWMICFSAIVAIIENTYINRRMTEYLDSHLSDSVKTE